MKGRGAAGDEEMGLRRSGVADKAHLRSHQRLAPAQTCRWLLCGLFYGV